VSLAQRTEVRHTLHRAGQPKTRPATFEPIGNHLFYGIFKVRYRFKDLLEESDESGFSLRKVQIVPDVVIAHVLQKLAQVVLGKCLRTQNSNYFFVFLEITYYRPPLRTGIKIKSYG
jgi:hypothetical protein